MDKVLYRRTAGKSKLQGVLVCKRSMPTINTKLDFFRIVFGIFSILEVTVQLTQFKKPIFNVFLFEVAAVLQNEV